MPSSRDPSTLPGVDDLRRLCQALALLDAILCPEWEYRFHSFDARWNEGKEMASLRNGGSGAYFILFGPVGAILKGVELDSPVWQRAQGQDRPIPGLFDEVPADFDGFLTEPAFTIKDSTFCLWRRRSDLAWQAGKVDLGEGDDPDGSAGLLHLLDGAPEAYRLWAEEYFEVTVERWAVDWIMAHRPLTEEVVRALNPEMTLLDLAADVAEIAYPSV